MQVHKSRKILFLQGIYLSKCQNEYEIAHEKFDVDQGDTPDGDAIDVIPSYFTTKEDWPIGLNIDCWTCGNSCENKLVSIPTTFDLQKSKNGILGGFDAWTCASFHIHHFIDKKNKDKYQRNLKNFYNHMEPIKRISEIHKGFSPFLQKKHGVGVYTADEFHQKSLEVDQAIEERVKLLERPSPFIIFKAIHDSDNHDNMDNINNIDNDDIGGDDSNGAIDRDEMESYQLL